MDRKKVICQLCEAENKRSKVYTGLTRATGLGIDDFFDERGFQHVHDPNSRVTSYKCSNGHEWTESEGEVCPCPGCTWPKNVSSKLKGKEKMRICKQCGYQIANVVLTSCPKCKKSIISAFELGLRKLINTHSQENKSDTPDFILAQYLNNCLHAFNTAIGQRRIYCGETKKSYDLNKVISCEDQK